MSMLATALFAASLATVSGASAPAPATSAPQDATLRFVAAKSVLAGISFGMNTVDGRPLLLDQRTSIQLGAGRRTIWYSCPNEPMSAQGSPITIDVKAGTRYELVCRAGQQAQIRAAKGC